MSTPNRKWVSPHGTAQSSTSSGLKRKSSTGSSSTPSGASSSKKLASGGPRANVSVCPPRQVFYGVNQSGGGEEGHGEASYWNVQWRKPQTKKHKTWDGDAILIVRGTKCNLKDTDGKDIGSAKFTAKTLASGDELKVGGKEIELDSEISAEEFLSGSCFSAGSAAATPKPPTKSTSSLARSPGPTFKPMRPVHSTPTFNSPLPQPSIKTHVVQASSLKAERARAAAEDEEDELMAPPPPTIKKAAVVVKKESAPVDLPAAALAAASPVKKKQALFDPKKEGAVVMKRPTRDHQAKYNKKGYDVVDVVLDPKLSSLMRPHQKEGVKFLYECVMGLRKVEGTGAILADEMGLGKTLQTIALIWTLLKQNPYVGPTRRPIIEKVLIVCPVSLTSNWKKEFSKWLGRDTIGVFLGDGDKNHIQQFNNSRKHSVLVIGYEKLRTVIGVLASCQPPIDLIVCDEGHRLKSKDAKTSKMFDVLRTKRRVILSGTPLQNDLTEFWCMVDFINPGIFDSLSSFTKIYGQPILKSRQANATKVEKELGQARNAKLSEISTQFIIRRSADILSKFLPPKHEYVVFVAPSTLQLRVFDGLLDPLTLDAFIRGPSSQALNLVNYVRKVSNSPMLLRAKDEAYGKEVPDAVAVARAALPSLMNDYDMECSGKLIAVAELLRLIRTTTDEKVVLVSNFTQTLNILEAHCKSARYKYERLDGSTPQTKRQEMVDKFNKGPQADRFIFLLSSKSGGAGLNLIGASRLIMFDCDWNPSTDLQAMARVHRDGQKKKVFIYRFMTTGSIDEKIYQRQVTKLGLSSSVLDADQSKVASKSSDSFSPAELRDLFRIDTRTQCQTHDLLECDCLFEPLLDDDDSISTQKGGEMSLSEQMKAKKEALSRKLAAHESSDVDSGEEEAYITTASQMRPEKERSKREEKKAKKSKQDKLASLREWTHIDGLTADAPSKISDDILRSVLDASFKSSAKMDAGARPSRPLLPVKKPKEKKKEEEEEALFLEASQQDEEEERERSSATALGDNTAAEDEFEMIQDDDEEEIGGEMGGSRARKGKERKGKEREGKEPMIAFGTESDLESDNYSSDGAPDLDTAAAIQPSPPPLPSPSVIDDDDDDVLLPPPSRPKPSSFKPRSRRLPPSSDVDENATSRGSQIVDDQMEIDQIFADPSDDVDVEDEGGLDELDEEDMGSEEGEAARIRGGALLKGKGKAVFSSSDDEDEEDGLGKFMQFNGDDDDDDDDALDLTRSKGKADGKEKGRASTSAASSSSAGGSRGGSVRRGEGEEGAGRIDLRKMAERGQGGRMLFIFEKVTASAI